MARCGTWIVVVVPDDPPVSAPRAAGLTVRWRKCCRRVGTQYEHRDVKQAPTPISALVIQPLNAREATRRAESSFVVQLYDKHSAGRVRVRECKA